MKIYTQKNIVQLLLLLFCLFFLYQSQDVNRTITSYLHQSGYTVINHLLQPLLTIEFLHVFFILIWCSFILILFNIINSSLNLFYSAAIVAALLPAILFNGVINNQIFDLFFALVIIVRLLLKNKWSIKKTRFIYIASGFLWLIFSANYSLLFIIPVLFIGLQQEVLKDKIIELSFLPFLIISLFFGEKIFSLNIDLSALMDSLLNNNVMAWYHVLLLLLSIIFAAFFKSENKRIAISSLLLLLTYTVLIPNASILSVLGLIIIILLIKNESSPLAKAKKNLLTFSVYVLVPLSLSGLYHINYDHDSFKLGLNESEKKLFKFSSKTKLSGSIFNNIEAEQQAELFFKKGHPFFKNFEKTRKEKRQQLFNKLIKNPNKWANYVNENNVAFIYFTLENQPQEALLFLGMQLSSGNWAIIYEEKNKEILLARRVPENNNVIQQFEIIPNPTN